MTAYVVLIPPRARADDEDVVLVRDGWAWLAFIAPVLWFAFHRMWLWAAGFLALGLVLSVAADRFGWQLAAAAVGVLANLWAGLEAGALRIDHLRRAGWTEGDVVVAPGRQSAEDIHFANVALAGTAPAPAAMMPARPVPSRGGEGPALGLFDHDGDR